MTNPSRIKTVPLLDSTQGREIVGRLCRQEGIREDVFWGLVRAELKQVGKLKKRGITDLFNDELDKMVADHVD